MSNRRLPPIAVLLEIVAAVALGVPVIRYALAFQLAEPPLMIGSWALDISWLTGLLFGLTYEGAVYLGIREAFRAWKDGVVRWWLPLPVVALQVVAGIAIIAPVVEATQAHVALSAILGAWSWPWSVVLTGATALTLVTLAVTRTLRKDAAVASHTAQSSAQGENAQSHEKSTNALTPYRICATCGYSALTQPAYAGHMRKHSQPAPDNGHELVPAAAEETP